MELFSALGASRMLLWPLFRKGAFAEGVNRHVISSPTQPVPFSAYFKFNPLKCALNSPCLLRKVTAFSSLTPRSASISSDADCCSYPARFLNCRLTSCASPPFQFSIKSSTILESETTIYSQSLTYIDILPQWRRWGGG